MKTYLSINPAWLHPTPSVRDLDGKSILIVEKSARTWAHIRVSEPDPQSQQSGLCCVRVWQASIDPMNVKWANTGWPFPTSQAHQWEMYLTEDALPLIHSNEEDPEHGELVLEVPNTA